MDKSAAIAANLSVHCDIFVTGGRLGTKGRPAVGSGAASMVTSAISTNSRSRIFFATLGASVAAGLNGPGLLRPMSPLCWSTVGPSPVAEGADAAAASSSRPVWEPADGVNVGSPLRALSVGKSMAGGPEVK